MTGRDSRFIRSMDFSWERKIMKQRSELVSKHLRLGPVQLLLWDSTRYRHQLSDQYLKTTSSCYRPRLYIARVNIWDLYLCEFNQTLWVWGGVNAEYPRIIVGVVVSCCRIHPVVLKERMNDNSRSWWGDHRGQWSSVSVQIGKAAF